MRSETRIFNFPDRKPVLDTGSETRTQQHHAKSADLNEIVRRYGITNQNVPLAAADPTYYGDFSDVPDFREALDRTRAAQDHFESLPSELRNRFANDPVRLFGFVMDPKNAEEAVKLGLLKRQPVEEAAEPILVRVQAEPPASTNTTAS